MKPPLISGNEVIRAFVRAGFIKTGQRGSHVKLFHYGKQITLIIPNHKEVDRWTLKGILKDADMSVEEFVKFLK
ncbi:MAG: type II toxin-antitoxin system HicA family toxin [Candidatus Omnitrophica bacterium]|nr:type II toxin-antitoxin system HicA family toxin [Candidatus Omnitrophota bacterium]